MFHHLGPLVSLTGHLPEALLLLLIIVVIFIIISIFSAVYAVSGRYLELTLRQTVGLEMLESCLDDVAITSFRNLPFSAVSCRH
jgi:hypothetical protein